MSAVLEAPRTFATDRLFYTGMALLTALVVAIGFGPTFYLRPATTGPLSPLLLVHGAVFTGWFTIFIVQTALIAANKRAWHRTLGALAVALMLAMVVLGTLAAIDSLRASRVPVPGLDPRVFFAIPMRNMVVFPLLVGAALWFRNDAQTHKRLMLVATLSLCDAAFGRFPGGLVQAYGPPAFYAMTNLAIILGLVYDKLTRGRVHPAYWWGLGTVVGSQVLFLAISRTAPWQAFAGSFL